MSTDVSEQIRQLAAAFDDCVADVSVDEAIERAGGPVVTAGSVGQRSRRAHFVPRAVSSRAGMAAAVALLVVGLLGALTWIDQGESNPATSPTPPAVQDPAPAEPLGQFVWPAPARSYATLDELVAGFAGEVLEWDTFDISDGVDDSSQPQVFTISNTALEVNLFVAAIPSPEGWGFVQIGNGLQAGTLGPAATSGIAVDFPVSPDATSNSVAIRRSDGTIENLTTTSGRVELPDMTLAELVSVLVIGFDNEGQPITAVGGQFNASASTPPTNPQAANDASTNPTSSDQQSALEAVLIPPAGYLRAMNEAREATTQRCMADAGFDYQRAPNLEDMPTDGSEYVEFNAWDTWRSDEIARTPGFEFALFGTDGDGPDSCTGIANDAIFGELSAQAAAVQLRSDRGDEARTIARQSDTLDALRTDVALCVTDAGYPTSSDAEEVFSTIDAAVLEGFDPLEQCSTLTDLNEALEPLTSEQEQLWNLANPGRFEAVADEWNEDLQRFETATEGEP